MTSVLVDTPHKESPDELSRELYKGLRAECAGYIEKIPQLWLQKFVLVGGVVGFILTSGQDLSRFSGAYSAVITSVAICVIPVLAMLIDIRTLEYGLHARAISLFIAEHFRTPPVLGRWEETLWKSNGGISHVVLRSVISVVVTVVPTMGIVVMSLMLVGARLGAFRTLLTTAILICVMYAASTVGVWIFIWRTGGARGRLGRRRVP